MIRRPGQPPPVDSNSSRLGTLRAWPHRAGSACWEVSGQLIGEVPGTQITRFEADEEVVGGSLGICRSGLAAEIARRDSPHGILDSRGEEPGVAADLDSAVRRGMFAHHDARSWISPQMRRLHVAAASNDLEAAVSPFVPDGRQEHGAIVPIRGQNRQQAEFDQVSEIVRGEVSAHAGRLFPRPLPLRGSAGESPGLRWPCRCEPRHKTSDSGEPATSCMTGTSGHAVRSDRGSSLVPGASCRRGENATGRVRYRRSSMRLVLATATSASNGAITSAAAASARCSTAGLRPGAGVGDQVMVTDSHHPALRMAPAASSRRQCPPDSCTCRRQSPWFSWV